MDEDKRRDPRISYSQPVDIVFPETTVNGSVAGNISLNGIALKVQEFVPIGTILELELNLGAAPRVVWAKARVVRIREVLSEDCFEIGLKFIEDENLKKSIGNYISTCRYEPTNQARS